MLEVLTNPDAFFSKKIKDEIDFKQPLMIIATIAILGGITAYISINKIMNIMVNTMGDAQNVGMYSSVGTIVAIIGSIIGALAAWIIFSGIFYLLSSLFSGKGNFSRVLEFVAYGYLPTVIASLISIVLMYLVLNSPELNGITDVTTFSEIMIAHPYSIASTAVSIIMLVWSANIWVHAMKYARKLTTSNALKTVIIPVGIYILIQLYSLITTIL